MDSLGRHRVLDFYGCVGELLDDVGYVEKSMTAAADRLEATIVTVEVHAFEPHGVSGTVVISESHLAIHTWPEHDFAAVDLFTCSDELDFEWARSFLEECFRPDETDVREWKRGRRDRLERGGPREEPE